VFVNAAHARYTFIATRKLGAASQSSVQALMRDTLATARKLQQKSPEACFRYWQPEIAGPADVAQILTAGERSHTLALMSEVVRSASEQPVAAPAAAEVQGDLANVINAIYAEFGTDAQMVAHAEDPRVDRAKVCTILNSIYERILALPPDVSTRLIRVMATS
jgi:hypothetical protein